MSTLKIDGIRNKNGRQVHIDVVSVLMEWWSATGDHLHAVDSPGRLIFLNLRFRFGYLRVSPVAPSVISWSFFFLHDSKPMVKNGQLTWEI